MRLSIVLIGLVILNACGGGSGSGPPSSGPTIPTNGDSQADSLQFEWSNEYGAIEVLLPLPQPTDYGWVKHRYTLSELGKASIEGTDLNIKFYVKYEEFREDGTSRILEPTFYWWGGDMRFYPTYTSSGWHEKPVSSVNLIECSITIVEQPGD